MAAKQKISDLPQEEQEQIIAQMKELDIKGVYTTFTVECAKEKIKKKLEEKKPPIVETTEETSEETSEKKDGNEKEQEPPEPPKRAETPKAQTPVKKEPKKEDKKDDKVLICHICRSKVINGKCTGCGFELRV